MIGFKGREEVVDYSKYKRRNVLFPQQNIIRLIKSQISSIKKIRRHFHEIEYWIDNRIFPKIKYYVKFNWGITKLGGICSFLKYRRGDWLVSKIGRNVWTTPNIKRMNVLCPWQKIL